MSEPEASDGHLDLLEQIQGQVLALNAFALALCGAHPQPDQLRRHLGLAKELAIATVGALPISERAVDAMLESLELLERQLQRAETRPGTPGTP